MVGEITGVHFRYVIERLLATGHRFPHIERRIGEMRDDEWYPWAEFKTMLHEIAASMPPQEMSDVSMSFIELAKPMLIAQGFDDEGKMLSDWTALFRANVRNAEADSPRTVAYSPGRAIVQGSLALPLKLIEGYIRGILKIFGKVPNALECEAITGGYRFTIVWDPGTSK